MSSTAIGASGAGRASAISQLGNSRAKGTPLPLPLKILVFMKIHRFSAQNLERVGLTGKILGNKDLGAIFGSWTGVLAGRWVKSRQRTGPVTGLSTHRGWGHGLACVFEDNSSPTS